MKSNFIQVLLLFAMLFNIAHASIVTTEDDCTHAAVCELIAEQTHSTECGDLCDFHHLLHFTAIITSAVTFPDLSLLTEQPATKHLGYHPPFKETFYRPPII